MSGAIQQRQAGKGNGADRSGSMAGAGRIAGEIYCGSKQFMPDLGVMKRKERSSEILSAQVSIGRTKVGGLGGSLEWVSSPMACAITFPWSGASTFTVCVSLAGLL